jgi:glycosyltransferase involved in cell wall biosynthesis
MDVLVVSSDNEGTPVSIIEALAAGVAVVSTAVGGVPDLLRGGEFGHLVPPADPDALAEAVTDVIGATLTGGPEDRAAAGQSAVQRAIVSAYDVSRLASDLAGLYKNLLASKS